MKKSVKDLQTAKWKRDDRIKSAHRTFNELLDGVSIQSALDWWKTEMEESPEVRFEMVLEIYQHLQSLIDSKVIEKRWDVDTLNHNQKYMLTRLVENSGWEEDEKNTKLQALMSFINFLHEQTNGHISRLQAPPELKIQSAIRASSPKTLTLKEWWVFRDELEKISRRDALVAKLLVNTARTLSEVLDLTVDDLNFSKNLRITYRKGKESFTVQTDAAIANEMQEYLKDSKSHRNNKTKYLFVTSKGNQVYRTHFTKVFEKAGANANLGFKVSTKTLQWTYASDLLQRMKLTRKKVKELLNIKHLPRNLEI